MTVRVLLVDDDPMVCRALEQILASDPEIAMVATVHDGDEVIEAIHRHRPDVVLMDVRMGRQDGITTTAQIAALKSAPKVLILTTFDLDEVLLRSVHAGAAGFLLKTTPPRDIITAVHAVAAGEGALSTVSAGHLVEHVRSDPDAELRRAATELVALLTPREADVVRLVAHGHTNPQIAAELFLGEATVKTHLASAQGKLGASSRVEVGIIADRAGLR